MRWYHPGEGEVALALKKSLPEEEHTEAWVCISMFYEVTQDHGRSEQTGCLSDTVVQTTERDEKTRYTSFRKDDNHKMELYFFTFTVPKQFLKII